MYQISDGNEVQRIANWNEMIATLESWEGNLNLQANEGDLAALREELEKTGYQVEEVA
jgi:hypothetical protein